MAEKQSSNKGQGSYFWCFLLLAIIKDMCLSTSVIFAFVFVFAARIAVSSNLINRLIQYSFLFNLTAKSFIVQCPITNLLSLDTVYWTVE